jgi:pimeloyl-ACP methyl ester carboxylesterase
MDQHEPALEVTDLAGVAARTLVMASDDDLITLEHTVALYRGITNAELAVVPGTSHFLTQEKPDVTTRMVLDFLGTEPVMPIAPVHRGTVGCGVGRPRA